MPFKIHYARARQHDVLELRYMGNWHESVEFLYIISGDAEIYYECEVIDAVEGDLIVVNSYCNHFVNTKSSAEYYYILLDKSYLAQNGFIPDMQFEHLIKDNRFKDIIEEMYRLSEEMPPFYEAKMKIELMKMLILLSENYYSEDLHEKFIPKSVKDATLYIKMNYGRELSVEKIAKHVNVSKSHFSREFKKYIGMSLIDYINNVRCNQAKILLRKGVNVNEAAELCGFNNMSYFPKIYKKIIGNLPSTDLKRK